MTRPMRAIPTVLGPLLLAFAAGCAGPAQQPSPTFSLVAPSGPLIFIPPPTQEPQTSKEPRAPQSDAPSTTSLAGPTVPAPTSALPHGAPELEATLPSTFRGKPLFAVSFGPAELGASPAAGAITSLVRTAGGDPEKTAFVAANDAPAGTFNVLAISAPGASGTKLVDAYAAAALAAGESVKTTKTTFAGRQVTRLSAPRTNPLGDVWVYAVGDVMYGVQSKDEALVAELFGLLPLP